MGVLQRFERRLGGLVEGAFAKVFKGGVEPVEIASALARETDDRRAISANRTLVPNEFAVELASGDYTRLAPYKSALCDELAAMVREHAAEQRYTFVGPVSIRLAEATDLDVGVFRIRSSVAAADAGGFSSRGASGRPRPGGSSRPRLIIATKPSQEGGGGSEREFVLDSEVALIGRSVECEIRLNDTGVSRRHAEIRRMPDGRHVFADLGSTNGSLVNGRPAQQARLADGDRVEVGNTSIVYRNEEQRPPSRDRRPAEPEAYRPEPVDPYADGYAEPGGYPAEPGYDGGRGGRGGYVDADYDRGGRDADRGRDAGGFPYPPATDDGGYGSDPYRREPPAGPAPDPYGARPYRGDGFPERGAPARPPARDYPDERPAAPRRDDPYGGRDPYQPGTGDPYANGAGDPYQSAGDPYADSHPGGGYRPEPARRVDPYADPHQPDLRQPDLRQPDPHQDLPDAYPRGGEIRPSDPGRLPADPYADPRAGGGEPADGYWQQPDHYNATDPYAGGRVRGGPPVDPAYPDGRPRRGEVPPADRDYADPPRHEFPDRTW